MKTRNIIILLALALSAASARAQTPLTLDDAIRLALTRNERALIADARVEAAEARLRRARSFFFPELNLSSSYALRTGQGNDANDTLTNAATISATLFDARAFPLYRQARFSLQATEFQSEEDRRLLGFEAADAFVTTLSFEAVARAAERRRDFARAAVEDSRARFEAGLVSSNDVTRAELELATAERELLRANSTTASALLQLENLLATEIEGPLQITNLSAPASGTFDVQRLVAAAIANRRDLQARERQARALEEFASEPSRRFIPALGLLGQYRQVEEEGADSAGDGVLSLNMNWSVFDGGERLAERAERLAILREAELIVSQTRRRIELDVNDAVVSIRREIDTLQQAERAAEIARRNAQETQELYRQGLASALAVADANLRLFEAEVAEARARYDVSIAQLDLRAAVGTSPLSTSLDASPAVEGASP